MADCDETLQALEAYLDGELATDGREQVHEHLDGCLDCLHAFDFHAELKVVIATKCGNEPLPPALVAKLKACLGLPEQTT